MNYCRINIINLFAWLCKNIKNIFSHSRHEKQLKVNKLFIKEYLANPGYNSITSELELDDTEHGEVLTFMFCDESPWDFEKETQIIYYVHIFLRT